MNILFLSLGRLENINEPGIYTDLMRKLNAEGNEVYVVSSRERNLSLPTVYEKQFGINLLKVKTGNIKKVNKIEKGISSLSIEKLYISAIKKYLSDIKFDLIIYTTPPITFEKAVRYIKKRDGATSYLLLKDIFPQNAVDLKMFSKKSPVYSYFRNKEKKLYSISDYIGTMSPANKDFLLKHNPDINSSKVEICPNTITPGKIKISDDEKLKLREKYNIPNDKIVYIYGGNLGKPQGVDYLVECIKRNERNKDTFILIVGSGTEYRKLDKLFKSQKFTNAKLIDSLPKEEYEALVNSADVGLVFLDYRFTIPNFPSRLLSYMQASMPVIAATDTSTDIGEIIEENKFGYWNKSNNVEDFNDNLLKLKDSKLRESFGKNAREYLEDNFTSEHAYQIIMNHMG